MNMKEAFAIYGAKLHNPQWSCCAESPKGELVASLWQHHFGKAKDGVIKHVDNIERWTGAGANEFRNALDKAKATNQVIRAVIVHTPQISDVEKKGSNREVVKSFSVREEWLGKLVKWEGGVYEIEFIKS